MCESRFFICNKCGNTVGLIHGAGVPLMCCGEQMEHLEPQGVAVVIEAEHLCMTMRGARAAGAKSIAMIKQKELLPLTGYIHGGCSPIGMKKLFPTFIDETAILFEEIFVSGGKVGLNLKISPEDLAGFVSAEFADLV